MAGGSGDERIGRLRDLDGRGRVIAAIVGLLLVLPVAVSAGRAIADDWEPSGDEAVIAVRVHDVLSTDPPLTGLPSTSDLYGTGIRTRHLGPIEFYLVALPVRVLGPEIGLLLGAGAITAAALLITAWVALRRAGPGVALGVTVLLALTTWSTGTAVLTDPISSNIGGYPLLAGAVLAWALLLGDLRLLPLAVAVVSFAAQQHLAMVIPAGAVAAVAAIGTIAAVCASWRDPAARRRALRWVLAGAAVGAVLWLPIAIDQVTGDPGNLTAVLRFSGDSGRATLATGEATDAVLRSAGLPPLPLRRDVTGADLITDLGPSGTAIAVLSLAGLAVLTVVAWRRNRPLALLGPVGLALAAAGFVAATNVPASFESLRINLYRWCWTLAFVMWWAYSWATALALRGLVIRSKRTVPAAAVRTALPVLAIGTMVVVVVASLASTGPDDLRRDADAFAADHRLGGVAFDAVGEEGPVLVLDDGTAANLSFAPAVIARLVDEGTEVQVPATRADAYGDERRFDPGTARSTLLVASRFGAIEDLPGERLDEVELTPGTADVVARLVDQARAAPVHRSARADELRAALRPQVAAVLEHGIDNIVESPFAAFTSPVVLDLLLDGYLESPTFDRADLEAMRRAVHEQKTIWTHDRVALYRLTPEELRAYRPDLFR